MEQDILLKMDGRYQFEWLKNEAKPSEVTEVLKLGTICVSETLGIVREEFLRSGVDEKFKIIEEKGKKDLEETIEKYEHKIEIATRKHEEEIEIHYGNLVQENKDLREKIYEREDKLRKEYEDKEREFRQDLLKFKDIYTFSDNNRKGDLGEKNISIRLQKMYTASEVKDIHTTSDSGDIWIRFPEDNCVILVESKLKKDIKTDKDLDKFKDDMIDNKYNVDCGLFVSLLPASIPNLGDMHISMINDKYVGYITDVFNEPTKLPLMIRVLRHLRNSNKKNEIEDKEELIENINKYLDKTLMYENIIKNIKKNNDNILNLVENNAKSIAELNNKLLENMRDMNDYLEDNNLRNVKEHNDKKAINEKEYSRQKIRQFFKQNGKFPSVEEASKITGFTKSKISRLGGISRLSNNVPKII